MFYCFHFLIYCLQSLFLILISLLLIYVCLVDKYPFLLIDHFCCLQVLVFYWNYKRWKVMLTINKSIDSSNWKLFNRNNFNFNATYESLRAFCSSCTVMVNFEFSELKAKYWVNPMIISMHPPTRIYVFVIPRAIELFDPPF